MKFIYCSNCGIRLAIFRKALPKFGVIIDMAEPHTCSDEPIEFDLKPIDIPTFTEPKGKFVKKLNNLSPARVSGIIGGVDSNTLRDRRFEPDESKPKSSAPDTLLNMIKDLGNSIPDKPLIDPEEV